MPDKIKQFLNGNGTARTILIFVLGMAATYFGVVRGMESRLTTLEVETRNTGKRVEELRGDFGKHIDDCNMLRGGINVNQNSRR